MEQHIIEDKISFKDMKKKIKQENKVEGIYIIHLNKLMFKYKMDIMKIINAIKELSDNFLGFVLIGIYEDDKHRVQDINEANDYLDKFSQENNIIFMYYDYFLQENEEISLKEYLKENLIIQKDYSSFTKYYYENQEEIDYSLWINEINKTVNNDNFIVDLGCGYAPYASNFKKENYVGIDISKEMIRYAKQDNINYEFTIEDMKKYNKKSSHVISLLDSFNYLKTKNDVTEYILNIKKNLMDNGFVFIDIHDLNKVQKFNDYYYEIESTDETFKWESKIINSDLVHFFIIEKNNRRYVEKHIQRLWTENQVIEMFVNQGFNYESKVNTIDHTMIKFTNKMGEK